MTTNRISPPMSIQSRAGRTTSSGGGDALSNAFEMMRDAFGGGGTVAVAPTPASSLATLSRHEDLDGIFSGYQIDKKLSVFDSRPEIFDLVGFADPGDKQRLIDTLETGKGGQGAPRERRNGFLFSIKGPSGITYTWAGVCHSGFRRWSWEQVQDVDFSNNFDGSAPVPVSANPSPTALAVWVQKHYKGQATSHWDDISEYKSAHKRMILYVLGRPDAPCSNPKSSVLPGFVADFWDRWYSGGNSGQ